MIIVGDLVALLPLFQRRRAAGVLRKTTLDQVDRCCTLDFGLTQAHAAWYESSIS